MPDKKKKDKKEAKEGSKNKLLIILGVFAALLLVLAVVGRLFYGQISERLVETFLSRQTGGQVDVDEGGKKVSFRGEDGEFSFGEGELPENFPDDFPVYENASITSSVSEKGDGVDGFSVLWETSDPVDVVSEFYTEALEESSWQVTQTTRGDDSVIITFEREDVSGFVAIATGDEGKTAISVNLGVGVPEDAS